MATRYQDGIKMIEACDEAGVRLFVVKQNGRNATLQLLKRAIDEALCAFKMVHLNVFGLGLGLIMIKETDGVGHGSSTGAFMNQATATWI